MVNKLGQCAFLASGWLVSVFHLKCAHNVVEILQHGHWTLMMANSMHIKDNGIFPLLLFFDYYYTIEVRYQPAMQVTLFFGRL